MNVLLHETWRYPVWPERASLNFANVYSHFKVGKFWIWKRNVSQSQMKHQLDATLCRFYFCRVTLLVSGASAHHQEYLKLVQRPLVRVLSLQVSHHISLLGPEGPNKEMWWSGVFKTSTAATGICDVCISYCTRWLHSFCTVFFWCSCSCISLLPVWHR